jgi:hypothetical protein
MARSHLYGADGHERMRMQARQRAAIKEVVSITKTICWKATTTPSARLWMLRDLFLIAHPPLLAEEGKWLLRKIDFFYERSDFSRGKIDLVRKIEIFYSKNDFSTKERIFL